MKNIILFFGSLFFYAWGEPVYVLLMLFSTIVDYFHGRWIESCIEEGNEKQARTFLLSSIIINVCILAFFKYSGLVPLPIGVSFYTFQTMSYSIDIYRREGKAQKNLLDFGVFVTLFPQLIAGPIVKYHEIEKELRERTVTTEKIREGIYRFLLGLSKKVLIANQTGLLFTKIMESEITQMSVLTAWLGMIAYAFQIYFDFSGYSDMAIGMGKMMGFTFPENFHYPYYADSVSNFWNRWHISLGSWFKQYVYIPLGGNRVSRKRLVINLLIVWSLTGIWHGAGINFLLWGLWFALFLIIEKLWLNPVLTVIPMYIRRWYTGMVVLIGWVFFSIEDFTGILKYLLAMFGFWKNGFIDSQFGYYMSNYGILLVIAALGSIPLGGRLYKKEYGIALLIFCIAYIVASSYNPFLYFRF